MELEKDLEQCNLRMVVIIQVFHILFLYHWFLKFFYLENINILKETGRLFYMNKFFK